MTTESSTQGEAQLTSTQTPVRTMFRAGALLSSSKAIGQISSFARNIVIARIIGASDFGIASVFAMTISLFDMLSSLSIDRLLVQATDGDDEQFQAAGHALQALRGFASAALVAILASPVAALFGAPKAAWAFHMLALVPLIRGFAHLDVSRIQRNLRFGASIKIEVAQQVISACLAWPIAKTCGNYAAMLWILILQACIGTIGSFLLSDRDYRWNWDPRYIRRFMTFGWPLLANAILLFGIFQGDRFLIGAGPRLFGSNTFSLADLGVFAVATSLTLTPMVAFGGICSALLLPVLSKLQRNPITFQSKYDRSVEIISFLTMIFAVAMILLGPTLIARVYGSQYAAAGVFVGWMAAGQAFRMNRFGPSTAAMALGDTKNSMFSNLFRFCALAGTIAVIAFHGSLAQITIAGCIGEFTSLVISLWKLRNDHRVSMHQTARALAILTTTIALAFIFSRIVPFNAMPLRAFFAGTVATVGAFIYLTTFPELRRFAASRTHAITQFIALQRG